MIDSFTGKYSFLSNFYVCPMEYWDLGVCATSEHAYQASKTDDVEWRGKIVSAAMPGLAKRLGSAAPLRDNWDNIKVSVMLRVLENKFSNPELASLLMNTNPHYLVEGNRWHDREWGVCMCHRCRNMVSTNKLGELLMVVRDKLITEFN